MTPEARYGTNWQEQVVGFQVVRFGCPRYDDVVLIRQKNGYHIGRVALNIGQIELGQPYLILQKETKI